LDCFDVSAVQLQVYKAFRNGVQVVAVKIFTDQVPGENQARYAEAFRREIFILRSCHDRNIVQFLGACLQVRSYADSHDLAESLVDASGVSALLVSTACVCL